MTRRAATPSLWDDPPGSRPKRGRTRRAAETTVRSWRSTRKLEDSDALPVSLLYRASDLLDSTLDDPDESTYVRAVVLGRVTDVARFVIERVGGDDADGPTLADMLSGMVHTEDTGPAH